jgi:hypothetical protein
VFSGSLFEFGRSQGWRLALVESFALGILFGSVLLAAYDFWLAKKSQVDS